MSTQASKISTLRLEYPQDGEFFFPSSKEFVNSQVEENGSPTLHRKRSKTLDPNAAKQLADLFGSSVTS